MEFELGREAGGRQPTMRYPSIIALVSSLLLGSLTAGAHGVLDRASPSPGSTMRSAPAEVAIWFTQKLEPAFSTITVTNAAGERVDTGGARVSGKVMRVSLRPGGGGIYHVTWRVLSVDTHTTEGSYSFQVEP